MVSGKYNEVQFDGVDLKSIILYTVVCQPLIQLFHYVAAHTKCITSCG